MLNRADDSFKTRDGCRIAYSLYSRPGAPRIALVHSLAMDRSFWDRVVEVLDGQAEILTFDCRGHGQSSLMKGPYKCSVMARDLSELVVHLNWPSVHLAGCSMGGCVAQAFAAEFQSQTDSLCLIDTTAWYGQDAPTKWSERARIARDRGLSALIEFQSARWFSESFKECHPQILERLNAVFLGNDVDCYQASCEMMGDADLREEAGEIQVPTTIMVGAEDYATPVAMAEWLHKAIPHSALEIIAGCKHLSPVERPDVVGARLLDLVAGAGSGRKAGPLTA